MNTTRRKFLGMGAASGLALAGTAQVAGAAADDATLTLGVIGVGWYGRSDARAALKVGGVSIVAICDLDSAHLDQTADELEKAQGARPKGYKHHRDLLKHPGLDAVIIATPPQWHALQLLDALDADKDVYLEKPVSYDIREGRAMVDAVKKSGRLVQVGFQRRQSASFQAAAEFLQNGGIGKVVQADVHIHYRAGTKDPAPVDPPATLDWDLWCGPAPLLPYSEQTGHVSWRLEKTTGHGHLVDWGIHNIDGVRNMLGLGMPKRITADGGIYRYQDIITTPDTLTVHYEFDELPVIWRHRLWGATEMDPGTTNGIVFYGENGTVFASDRKWVVVRRAGKETTREEHEAGSDMGTLHMAAFLDAVRTGGAPACTIEDAYRSTATVQLGMVAYESGSVVRWDEAGERILDNPAASALLKREYRKPWKHPHTG